MLEPVREMVRNVTALILLAAFMEMILPSSSLQKYVKVVMGLFLIVSILNPVMSLVSRNQAVEVSAWQLPDRSGELESILENGRNLSRDSEQIALKEYSERLEGQVEALVKLNPNVGMVEAKVEVGGMDSMAGGRIERVLLQVQPDKPAGEAGEAGEEGSGITEIEPIEVDSDASPEPDIGPPAAGSAPYDEMARKIRETVSSFYGLSEDKIQVVIDDAENAAIPGEG